MIYYVEDDAGIRELVVYTLKQTGFEACGFAESEEFYSACATQKPDLILLDIMLPREDGLSILKRIRQDAALKSVPTIMVTAKGSEYDKVLGLDLGADDYIVKPFGMLELVARIKARLRSADGEKSAAVLSCGALRLDSRRHEVTVEGQPATLTLKEFTLLEMLMRHPGMVFTREQLLERNWEYSYEGGTRTVDVHIQTLRGKLGSCASLIHTVRGVGYKLEG